MRLKSMTTCHPILIAMLMAISPDPAPAGVWYARANGTGDGQVATNPIGSPSALEAVTKPGDVIILLPSEAAFEGGLVLKPGQTLMGLAEGNRKPSITNTDTNRHDGNGVVLANDTKVLNVRIERTRASGVLGVEVSGAVLLGVDVQDANQSTNFTSATANVLGRIPHGGILFIATQSGRETENRVHESTVTNATGISIGAVALGSGRNRLLISHASADKGNLVPPLFDVGILALADGRSSETQVELSDTSVCGRLSEQGRNVLAFASADAKATARIERCQLRECGQDGVCAVAAMVPATVEVQIRHSTIERAGQMNIEGTILNLPPSDPARANESLVSLDATDCVISDAGAVGPFRAEAHNIWLAPTSFGPGPFARGHYRLSVRNSTVTKANRTGIEIGNDGREFKIASDEGDYQVTLRANAIMDNGASEIAIAAAGAHIDARQNWWGTGTGLATNRVSLIEKAQWSQLDASQPLARQKDMRGSR
jgi:hypothetical protein